MEIRMNYVLIEEAGGFFYKYRILRKLWSVLDSDFIALTDAQVNPDLLEAIYNILEFLFQVEMHIVRLSNNSYELISQR